MSKIITKPCELGDIAYEVDLDPSHGIITHVVSNLTFFEKNIVMSDSSINHINDWNIGTNATDCNGNTWNDNYSSQEWENRITSYEKAEEILKSLKNKSL